MIIAEQEEEDDRPQNTERLIKKDLDEGIKIQQLNRNSIPEILAPPI